MTTKITYDYIENQANLLFNHTSHPVRHAIDYLRTTFQHIGTAYLAVRYGLRQEVPFERWFFDYGFQKPLEDPLELIKARQWALLAAAEGAFRTTAELACYVYSQVIESKNSEHHLNILKAQWQGFTLSLLAVVSPNLAKEKAHHSEGKPLIGASLLNWKWGTLYTGKLESPLGYFKCHHDAEDDSK